ncbi:hypothetical protein N7471_008895 [Penicillium samsonianum]|uniref:uncharacterized protein n=1 Tax=Penicillium samsonianum TaxID=1882272 RepID=UPI002549253A|nr:uncharacterized protein N7471_008895 [Penicillium samsonianum]KAJ6127678.1 hypothetical protein N7471_008895 [Penicillium samsonianum]
MASNDFPLASWENFAHSWDEGMGDEGNDYFRFLELPILEKLIGRLEGCRAIDLATGNGLVARWLAQKAASVIATDGAVSMIDRAKARTDTSQYGNRISFNRLDVTKQSSWDTFMAIDTCLMDDGFDVVTMNMALMDIQDLGPLARSLRLLLKPNGCFVATLLHPLFFTSGAARQIVIHEEPETGQRIVDRSIVISKYLNVPPARQLVFGGETESPYLFHRPLNQLFAPFFQAGLAVDALEETNFDESFRDPLREHASKNFTEFPKILGFRMRRVSEI